MRLEDALLFVMLDGPRGVPVDRLCREALAGGADVICAGASAPEEQLAAAAAACAVEQSLFLVAGDADVARRSGAHGVHLDRTDGPLALARTAFGRGGIVGAGARGIDEALLGLELGVDYLWFEPAGADSRVDALHGLATVPVFAAGVRGEADAAERVRSGVYRLGVRTSELGTSQGTTEIIAAISRRLGRIL